MPRIRSIHPGFFTDEAVMELTVECPVAIPLLLGIWCESDDFGTFEWKPITLKARCLPALSVNIAELLDRLIAGNFIRRFEIDGRPVGVLRNCAKYQRPKKPKAVHPHSPESRAYAGYVAGDPPLPLDDDSGEPVPHQFPTGGEFSPQREEEGGGEKTPAAAAGAPVSKSVEGSNLGPNVIAMPTHDLLEAEARAMMAGCAVADDPDFSPLAALIGQGVTRADVLAGLRDCLAKAGVRPKSWDKLAGWAVSAARVRQSRESAREAPRIRDGPAQARTARVSASSVWGDIGEG